MYLSTGIQRMEPDPLLERLDTVLGEDSEKLGFVPTELPPGVEDILEALKSQTGVESISLGRQAGIWKLEDALKMEKLDQRKQSWTTKYTV